MVCKEQPCWQAQHLASSEGSGDDAHHPAAHFKREQVSGNCEHHRSDHPAKKASNYAGHQKHGIGGGQCTEQGAQHEATIEEQE